MFNDPELYPTDELRRNLYRFDRLVREGEVDPDDHPEMEHVRAEVHRRAMHTSAMAFRKARK